TGPQGPAGPEGPKGPKGDQGPAGPSYTLPAAAAATLGGVKQMAAIADLSAAPTQQDFNNLLAALRTAGMLATS
ncbi:head fiber protein, partial [Flavonifractor plautii]